MVHSSWTIAIGLGHLSFVLCPLSFVLCPLSLVLYPLSFILYPLSLKIIARQIIHLNLLYIIEDK